VGTGSQPGATAWSEVDPDIGTDLADRNDLPPPQVTYPGRTRTGDRGQAVVAAAQGGGDISDVTVHEPSAVKRTSHRRAALDQNLQHAPVPEVVKEVLK
jgi:transcriptional regulator CtsR